MDQADRALAEPARTRARFTAGVCLGLALAACSSSGAPEDTPSGAPDAGDRGATVPPYATRIVSFDPGDGAGFGQDKLPDVVLGPPTPPHGPGGSAGSLDVLSLGKGGSIVLGFAPLAIRDGEGADLVVFENPFWPGGDRTAVFAEPGEVSVSDDGETWLTFPCDAAGDGAGHFDGCAGVTPTEPYDPEALVPLDPALTGGDAFDLADLGVARASFVKIHDLSNMGATPSAGFDLDAVGIVNGQRQKDSP